MSVNRVFSNHFLKPVQDRDDFVRNVNRYITKDPHIKGGAEIIRGTRIDVHGIALRVADGDTIEMLIEDYPYVSTAAFETAVEYAQINPLPVSIKPWLTREALHR